MSSQLLLSPLLRLLVLFFVTTQTVQAAVREIATISTNLGNMEFELFADVSPRAVANFKYLADTKFYDSTAFHRHIAGFMVQGGDPLTRGTTRESYNQNINFYGQGGPEYTIPNEPTDRVDRAHVRGVLSMAKTEEADSGGSQFFVMFGSAPWLDKVHAPMGSLIQGADVLQAIEAQTKNSNDLPVTPIVIESVRVRAELTGDIPGSKMRFKAGTVGGLLRRVDRNQDACGTFQISVLGGGSFSGRIQYYGRRKVFTGAMLQGSGGVPEAVYAGTLDGSAGVPLRVRLSARQTSSSTTSFVLSLGEWNEGGTDFVEATFCVGAGMLAPLTPLAERYTAAFYPPAEVSGTVKYPDLNGFGNLSVSVRTSSGLALVKGCLADNTKLVCARPVSNEGGRVSVSMFNHDLQPQIETSRAGFSSIPLSDWSDRAKYFNFEKLRFRLVSALELPPRPGSPQFSNATGNQVVWYRDARKGTPVSSQIEARVPAVVAAFTPPVAGKTLVPFSAGERAQMFVGSSSIGAFVLGRSNAAGVFDPSAFAPRLSINPIEGTFQGSLVEGGKRRTFQGVLLQNSSQAAGFLLIDAASLPVFIKP